MLDGETVRTNVSLTHGFAAAGRSASRCPIIAWAGASSTTSSMAGTRLSACPTADVMRDRGPLLYPYGAPFAPSFMLTDPQSGIGDAQVKFARLIGRDQGYVVQASVKLPTGDEPWVVFSAAAPAIGRSHCSELEPLLARRRAAGYFWGVGLVRAGRSRIASTSTRIPGCRPASSAAAGRSLPKFGLQGPDRRARRVLRYAARGDRRDRRFRPTLSAWRRIGRARHARVRRRRGSRRQHGARRRASRSPPAWQW